jgi:hypothetical protein
MKKVLFAGVIGATFVACMPGASLDKEKLVKTAAFDHGCPPEKVQIVTEEDHGMEATGNYLLKVCGADRKYKRAGTMYYDAEKGNPMMR